MQVTIGTDFRVLSEVPILRSKGIKKYSVLLANHTPSGKKMVTWKENGDVEKPDTSTGSIGLPGK